MRVLSVHVQLGYWPHYCQNHCESGPGENEQDPGVRRRVRPCHHHLGHAAGVELTH